MSGREAVLTSVIDYVRLSVCLVAVVSNGAAGTACCMSSGSDAPCGSRARRNSEVHTRRRRQPGQFHIDYRRDGSGERFVTGRSGRCILYGNENR
ncbi:hypothetical protein F5883DRAFT_552935 [Diaporthe sp. PMI_573]|jgi:hypothetical protein|nr:hypothetical protein F5883DRAFT_552935 [Diaporthaceae sp. PMI_573]